MNYDVYIKGHRDPISVENGDDLKKDWFDYLENKKDRGIELKGFTGKLSDIKNFRKVPTRRYVNQDDAKKEWDFYVSERKKTPDQKSKQLGFFKLLYYGFTNIMEPESDVLKKAQAIQLKFFTKNPKRTIPDPTIFKPLTGDRPCAGPVVDILSRQVAVDIIRSRK